MLRVYLPDIDAGYLWAYFQLKKTPLLHDLHKKQKGHTFHEQFYHRYQTTYEILKICRAYK